MDICEAIIDIVTYNGILRSHLTVVECDGQGEAAQRQRRQSLRIFHGERKINYSFIRQGQRTEVYNSLQTIICHF